MFQICYSGNLQYSGKVTCLKVATQINSEKQFRFKFNKVAKVAGCKITAYMEKLGACSCHAPVHLK